VLIHFWFWDAGFWDDDLFAKTTSNHSQKLLTLNNLSIIQICIEYLISECLKECNAPVQSTFLLKVSYCKKQKYQPTKISIFEFFENIVLQQIRIDHFKIAHVTKKAYTKFTGYEIGNRKVWFRGGFSFASSLVKWKKSKLEISNFSVSRKRLRLDFIQK